MNEIYFPVKIEPAKFESFYAVLSIKDGLEMICQIPSTSEGNAKRLAHLFDTHLSKNDLYGKLVGFNYEPPIDFYVINDEEKHSSAKVIKMDKGAINEFERIFIELTR